MRQKQVARREASRKRWRQRHQQRVYWGPNEYVDDDLVSRLLVKWPFALLVQYSKLIVILLNRRTAKPPHCALPGRVASLVHYKYPSEYYETLFADYTHVLYGNQRIPFRSYYTQVYREALATVHSTSDEDLAMRPFHVARLRACFVAALAYDMRIRRFVLSNHDIHYEYMGTHAPPLSKTLHFIQALRPSIDHFLTTAVDVEATALANEAFTLWLDHYMFLLK